jgi:diadenosine tetraphosphate (Ap4A) HIT family hydrolase
MAEEMKSEREATCVFCRIVRGELTPGVLAFCDSQTAVFPSRQQQPRNRGHMIVVPTRHVAHVYDVSDDLAGPLMTTIARVAVAVKAVFSAQGVSVRQNNERHGGQDVFHLHFHVIPRFAGDEFNLGDGPFPFGAMEVPLEQRIEQGLRVRDALQEVAANGSGGTG